MPAIALRFVRCSIIASYLDFLFVNMQRLVAEEFLVLTDLIKLRSEYSHGARNFAQIMIVLTCISEALKPH